VYFEGKVLLASSRTPFFDAARAILSEGYPKTALLEMSRRGSSQVDFRGELGRASETSVLENSRAGPYFSKYIPFSGISED
jgi:hypothetical protein